MDLLQGEHQSSRGEFYRQLLVQTRVFLTELDVDDDRQSSIPSRSDTSKRNELFRSASAVSFSRPTTASSGNEEFTSTRQRCHQRLLACSRKKLRLLTIQEQVCLSRLFSLPN